MKTRAGVGAGWMVMAALLVAVAQAAEPGAGAIEDRTRLTVQEPVCPVVLNPEKINILLAVESACSKSIGRRPAGGGLKALRFWLQEWTHPDECVTWKVSAPRAGNYELTFIVKSAQTGAVIRAIGPKNEISHTTHSKGWEREKAAGALELPAGESVVTLKLARENSVTLKLVELTEQAARAAIEQRIAAFRSAGRAELERFSSAGYGIMVVGGGWAYPRTGDKKPWPKFAEDFNVRQFADQVESMGGKFVIWSATCYRYLVPAPIKAVDEILPGRTASRDLLGELADEFQKRGIQFFLYYHEGHVEPEWWKRNWDPARPGHFQDNWMKVIREMGARYGDRLAGWFFDDDAIYCPSDYEALSAAARAGHPGRLVSYNPYVAPAFSPFQDVFFGEVRDRGVVRDGIFTEGPNRGLQAFHMRIVEGPDWGVNKRDLKANPPQRSIEQTEAEVRECLKNKTPVALNLLMWEDGSMPEQSVQQLQEIARRMGRVVQR